MLLRLHMGHYHRNAVCHRAGRRFATVRPVSLSTALHLDSCRIPWGQTNTMFATAQYSQQMSHICKTRQYTSQAGRYTSESHTIVVVSDEMLPHDFKLPILSSSRVHPPLLTSSTSHRNQEEALWAARSATTWVRTYGTSMRAGSNTTAASHQRSG